MELTAGGSYTCRHGIYKGDQQKSDIVQGSPFLALVYSRSVTQFYGIVLAMTFDFPRISKINLETSVEYLQRHFLNLPACFSSGTDH